MRSSHHGMWLRRGQGLRHSGHQPAQCHRYSSQKAWPSGSGGGSHSTRTPCLSSGPFDCCICSQMTCPRLALRPRSCNSLAPSSCCHIARASMYIPTPTRIHTVMVQTAPIQRHRFQHAVRPSLHSHQDYAILPNHFPIALHSSQFPRAPGTMFGFQNPLRTMPRAVSPNLLPPFA